MPDQKYLCKYCGGTFNSETGLEHHSIAKHADKIVEKKELFDSKMKKQIRNYGIIAIIALLVIIGGYTLVTAAAEKRAIGPVGSVHWHADVSVMINGKAIDFSQSRYQLKAQHVHFEDGDGRRMHKHATGVTLITLFETLGITADSECINVEGNNYCNGNGNTLRFTLNGELVSGDEMLDRDAQDGDTYLIEYF